jgi:Tol biopolymer transport system component
VLHRIRSARRTAAIALAAMAIGIAAPVSAKDFGAWELATPEPGINIPAVNDGCPIESPDGRSLFIASNRPGTLGGNDIWVATRPHEAAAWSEPVNLGAPINTAANDFCPTPLNGNWLLFVSERTGPDTCNAGPGLGDIYLARYNPALGWSEPLHLGCDASGTGPNFPGGEFGPSLVLTAQGTFLYFSSTGYGADMDIYASRMRPDGTFEPAVRVNELSTEGFADFMPNVRRDGLEIVLNSNRPGGLGGQDIYTATRSSTADPWSTPVNLGGNVNTAGNETRSSLSGDGHRLHFGRDGDVYVSERSTVPAGG